MKTCKESKLQNGLTVLTIEDPSSLVTTFSFCLRAGSRYERPHESGYAHLVEHMLLKGTVKMPSVGEVGLIADRAGALLTAETNVECININAQSVRKQDAIIFDLLADIIMTPLFDKQVLENEKQVVFQEIHRARDNRSALWYESTSRLFGDHPLGKNVLGEEKEMRSVTPDDLRAFYERFFIPSRTVIMVSGARKHNEIVTFAEHRFKNWREKEEKRNEIQRPILKGGGVFVMNPGRQTQLYFNFLCLNIESKVLVGLNFLAHVLGYGKTPFLKQELRHKNGLVYSIGVRVVGYRDASLFYISTASTKPEEVIRSVKEFISRFGDIFNEQTFLDLQSQYRDFLMRVSINPFFEIDIVREFWITCGILMPMERIVKIISSFTRKDVLDIKDKYLTENNLFITAFGEREIKF